MAKDTSQSSALPPPKPTLPEPAAATPPVGEPSVGRVLDDEFGRPTVEEPRVERDAGGDPRSASIESRPASGAETLLGRPLPARATRSVPDLLPTTLPATTRVLPSGFEVPAKPKPGDAGEERVFTATARILRSRKLYDVGAPVPLTRAEYVTKRRVDAIEERSFDEGDDLHPSEP